MYQLKILSCPRPDCNLAGYHFSAIFVQFSSEGLQDFGKGYHIEKASYNSSVPASTGNSQTRLTIYAARKHAGCSFYLLQ